MKRLTLSDLAMALAPYGFETDLPDASSLLLVPPEVAANTASFPKGCPVMYFRNIRDGASANDICDSLTLFPVGIGIVEASYVNLNSSDTGEMSTNKGFIHKIRPTGADAAQNPSNDPCVYVHERALRYAPGCPAKFNIGGKNSDTTSTSISSDLVEGIILRGSVAIRKGKQDSASSKIVLTTTYSALLDVSGNHMEMSEIDAERIKFLPESCGTNNSSNNLPEKELSDEMQKAKVLEKRNKPKRFYPPPQAVEASTLPLPDVKRQSELQLHIPRWIDMKAVKLKLNGGISIITKSRVLLLGFVTFGSAKSL